jgi:hypothetical protein
MTPLWIPYSAPPHSHLHALHQFRTQAHVPCVAILTFIIPSPVVSSSDIITTSQVSPLLGVNQPCTYQAAIRNTGTWCPPTPCLPSVKLGQRRIHTILCQTLAIGADAGALSESSLAPTAGNEKYAAVRLRWLQHTPFSVKGSNVKPS